MSYAKLFSTITDSSLWSASKDARILFVSMLARADSTGFIEAALPGLARMANLTMDETCAALADLMAPDPHSKSHAHEGRRVVVVDGGWCLVNYESYRERRNEEERREYMREYMKKYRKDSVNKSKHDVNESKHDVNKSKPCKPPLAKAEAEAEAEAEKKSAAASPPPPTREQPPQPHENNDLFDVKPISPHMPVPKHRDWPYFRQTHERLFISRSDEDGSIADWKALFDRAGGVIMDAMYRALVPGLKQKTHGIGFNAAVRWIAENTVEKP